MSLSVRYLLDRLRHPRSRADELARLRARFAAQPGRLSAGRRAVELAVELRGLRITTTAAFGRPTACRDCARGHPLPAGRWDGGHCCGGHTLDIFSPLEVTALKLGGTSARRLRPPPGDHAGCAFRGPSGCCLEPADRPTICVRHVCAELRRELIDRGRWQQLAPLKRRMGELARELAQLVGCTDQARLTHTPLEPLPTRAHGSLLEQSPRADFRSRC